MNGQICDTKSRGRQRTKYTDTSDSLNNFVTTKESPNSKLIRRTDDREDWKAMVHDNDNDDDDDDDDDVDDESPVQSLGKSVQK